MRASRLLQADIAAWFILCAACGRVDYGQRSVDGSLNASGPDVADALADQDATDSTETGDTTDAAEDADAEEGAPDGGGALDTDRDGIADDGDLSGVAGDLPCATGETTGCDDNCILVANPSQGDTDQSGVGNACEVCNDPTFDLNSDGAINLIDLAAFQACFNGADRPYAMPTMRVCACADRDHDDDVDLVDRQWFEHCRLLASPECDDVDPCPDDPDKVDPGSCGCGVPDADVDSDLLLDCVDPCVDYDDDGWADVGYPTTDCVYAAHADNCRYLANPTQGDADADGTGNACEFCNDPRFDYDGDGNVDSDDETIFTVCFGESSVDYGQPTDDCACSDFDHDDDVGGGDFGMFGMCFSGPGLADPACDDES